MDLFAGDTGVKLQKTIMIMVCVLALFLGITTIGSVMGWRYIGAGIAATNTIIVSGHGEVLAVPDIATFTVSVVSDKATVAEAQSDSAQKSNAVTVYLTGAGVDAKDIQTTDYSITPQYDYVQTACAVGIPCPPGNQALKGYEVRQTTTVKVRDTSKAGDLLAGVGSRGATGVSGLTFTLDNPDSVQAQARDKAITDAKLKASALAKSLGVSLVRIVTYTEGGSNQRMIYPTMMAGVTMGATAPSISVGQNTITSDVSVTYEII